MCVAVIQNCWDAAHGAGGRLLHVRENGEDKRGWKSRGNCWTPRCQPFELEVGDWIIVSAASGWTS